MNRFFRWGLNAFAMLPVLPTIVIFALTLAVPSYNAVRPVPFVEKVGDRYMPVARNHSGINCYGSGFSDATAQVGYDTLWVQVTRVSDLPAAVSTRINCAECHRDMCNATSEHLTDPSKEAKVDVLTLHNFLNQGQYVPLLKSQCPPLCTGGHASATMDKARSARHTRSQLRF